MTVSVSSKYGGALTAHDNLSAEHEVANFLASFVRLVKPKLVIETGYHLGRTAVPILDALEQNGYGALVTCDIEKKVPYMVPHSQLYFGVLSGREMIEPLSNIDVAFLDSGGNGERHREALALRGKLSPVAWVFLHDVLQGDDPCYAKIAEDTGWPSVVLPYGRGLALFMIGQDAIKAEITQNLLDSAT